MRAEPPTVGELTKGRPAYDDPAMASISVEYSELAAGLNLLSAVWGPDRHLAPLLWLNVFDEFQCPR